MLKTDQRSQTLGLSHHGALSLYCFFILINVERVSGHSVVDVFGQQISYLTIASKVPELVLIDAEEIGMVVMKRHYLLSTRIATTKNL